MDEKKDIHWATGIKNPNTQNFIKEKAGEWVKHIVNDKKTELLARGSLQPCAYFVYTQPFKRILDLMLAYNIPHFERLFESPAAKDKMGAFVKMATKGFIEHVMGDNDQIIGILVISDAYYTNQKENIPLDKCTPPSEDPSRRESIFALLDFYDSKVACNFTYSRENGRIVFGEEIIGPITNIKGRMESLFLSPDEVRESVNRRKDVKKN